MYNISISYGKKVMTKVKVFVHASNADADTRAMTLAPGTYVPARLKYTQWYGHVVIFTELSSYLSIVTLTSNVQNQ